MKFVKEKQMSKEHEELRRQIEKTKIDLEKQRKENIKLKDEVESLWGLLDEMHASDVKNWSHLLEKIEEDAILKQLMTTTKTVDC